MKKSALVAGAFSLMLVASACSSTDNEPAASVASSAAHSVASSVASSAPASDTTTTPQEERTTVTSTATKPAAQPEQDDDPGGHPCTDQSGAPGHLIAANGGVGPGWVCEITGDAPQADTQRHQQSHGQDDDPGGHPCTDQSGAPGHLIPDNGGVGPGWICEITGDAPRN